MTTETIPTDTDESEFERLVTRAVRVVHYNTAPPGHDFHQPKMKQTYIIGNLSQSRYEPTEVKRALAHAVKRGELKRDAEQFWIPGRPDGGEKDD